MQFHIFYSVLLSSFQVTRDQLYKNRSSRKIDSQRLFSREYDFPKTFSLTENQFSGKTYLYTIASSIVEDGQQQTSEANAATAATALPPDDALSVDRGCKIR